MIGTLHICTLFFAWHANIPLGLSVSPSLCTAGYNQLSSAAHHFLTVGLASSTVVTYSAGKRRYLQFCGRAKVPALPATETTIILSVSFIYLATTDISHSSTYCRSTSQLCDTCTSWKAYTTSSTNYSH